MSLIAKLPQMEDKALGVLEENAKRLEQIGLTCTTDGRSGPDPRHPGRGGRPTRGEARQGEGSQAGVRQAVGEATCQSPQGRGRPALI